MGLIGGFPEDCPTADKSHVDVLRKVSALEIDNQELRRQLWDTRVQLAKAKKALQDLLSPISDL